ncbi:flavodoxin domain-containing protein [Clostridium sp.]|uniref:flavodoxin domain-containing protein n=1 Tax=Clostridium sp. TaxID=1506 RepID=UPI003D6D2D08
MVYKSKTGFVRNYAEWITEELSADIFEVSKVDINMLTKYDTVVYGGSLHAVGINGVNFITKNIDKALMTLLNWKLKQKGSKKKS